MQSYTDVLHTYMSALGRSDYATITGLFVPEGIVRSPFLGEMRAAPFFDRLGEASEMNVITPIEVFLSDSDSAHAVAYFQYDWTVRDGSLITFKVMDLFTFAPDSDKITYLDLIYDTHPIRKTHGNKYESPSDRSARAQLLFSDRVWRWMVRYMVDRATLKSSASSAVV